MCVCVSLSLSLITGVCVSHIINGVCVCVFVLMWYHMLLFACDIVCECI